MQKWPGENTTPNVSPSNNASMLDESYVCATLGESQSPGMEEQNAGGQERITFSLISLPY